MARARRVVRGIVKKTAVAVQTYKAMTNLEGGGTITVTLSYESIAPSLAGGECPDVSIFGVEILTKRPGKGEEVWFESFGGTEVVKAFFEGLRAASRMVGGPYLELPNVPSPMI